MSLPFLLGVGSLEIEERRPRSANEPRVKRLYFTKNRRHVTDDRYRGRRGFSGEWAMVPHDFGQRRPNQIEEFDRRRTDAQLRFDEQEFRRQQRLNVLQLQHDEERHRRRTLEARQLNDIILQGQQIPPHYWHQMQEMQRNHDIQRRGMVQGHPERQPLPPPPPGHPHPGGGGGRGGHDGRIVPLSPGGVHGGGNGGGNGGENGEFLGEDASDESEHEVHHSDHVRGRPRSCSSRRGHRRHGEQVNDIVILDSDSDVSRSPRRIGGGHGQRLPRVFRPRPRSRSRAHRSHSRPRNPSRIGARRTPSRHRRYYYTDDSDTESEFEHFRIIRPRSRGSLRRRRSQSRHFGDYSSDDSFQHYNPISRRRRSRY